MTQNSLKAAVAHAALEYVPHGKIIGVGTGSTVNFFIDALAGIKDKIAGTVASSKATEARLKEHNIPVYDLNEISDFPLSVYIDGADEITLEGAMIKGGGGALTREKILASASARFICIADESKLVAKLGQFPLPIEVIPMAHVLVARQLGHYGGEPILRMRENNPYLTDNGNYIIDLHGLQIDDPVMMEAELNSLPGIVTVGLFAGQGASLCLLGGIAGIKTLTFAH